ncbi:MAG: hypothetical protein NTY17_00695 [Planctomycetia bacterium]|nr:hypothetical protein [Planctomycetia bacterium]
MLEVVLAGHQVVLGRDLWRVSEPFGDNMGGIPLYPVGLARRPEILQEPRPDIVPGLCDDSLQVRPEIDARPSGGRHDERCPGLGLLESVCEDRPKLGADRHDSHRVVAAVVLGFLSQNRQPAFLPIDGAPRQGAELGRAPETSQP